MQHGGCGFCGGGGSAACGAENTLQLAGQGPWLHTLWHTARRDVPGFHAGSQPGVGLAEGPALPAHEPGGGRQGLAWLVVRDLADDVGLGGPDSPPQQQQLAKSAQALGQRLSLRFFIH